MQKLIAHYVVANNKFLCSSDGALSLIDEAELEKLSIDILLKYPIRTSAGQEAFVVLVSDKTLEQFQWLSLRNLLEQLSEEDFQTAGRALQILRWHFDHQYCGRCGNRTVQHTHDLAKSCENCKLDFYPRLSPCIITLITRGDECLLAWHTRSKDEKYSCLAGFIEVGESPEQTLEREVMEEVGLSVKHIRYVASQPWPFPGQLMLGYFADYAGGDIQVDEHEIKTARWFMFDQLPKIPPITTISGRLINAFVQERYSIRSITM